MNNENRGDYGFDPRRDREQNANWPTPQEAEAQLAAIEEYKRKKQNGRHVLGILRKIS